MTQTKSMSLSNDFVVNLSTCLHASLSEWPKEIRLDIIEDQGLRHNQLASLYLPLPSSTSVAVESNSRTFEQAEFSSDKVIIYNEKIITFKFIP